MNTTEPLTIRSLAEELRTLCGEPVQVSENINLDCSPYLAEHNFYARVGPFLGNNPISANGDSLEELRGAILKKLAAAGEKRQREIAELTARASELGLLVVPSDDPPKAARAA